MKESEESLCRVMLHVVRCSSERFEKLLSKLVLQEIDTETAIRELEEIITRTTDAGYGLKGLLHQIEEPKA